LTRLLRGGRRLPENKAKKIGVRPLGNSLIAIFILVITSLISHIATHEQQFLLSRGQSGHVTCVVFPHYLDYALSRGTSFIAKYLLSLTSRAGGYELRRKKCRDRVLQFQINKGCSRISIETKQHRLGSMDSWAQKQPCRSGT